jgi:hypothetical protein
MTYLRKQYPAPRRVGLEYARDREAGLDCLERVAGADFWDWRVGSRLFFWRWPGEQRLRARDGLPVHVTGTLPKYRVPQTPERDVGVKEAVKAKLHKFIVRGYLVDGTVTSLVNYFAVPKGDADVRSVFDGTKSGLNAVLWAPSFCLPTVDSLTPMLEPGTWQSDMDVGEMFYNFMLDRELRSACGIDVQPYLGGPGRKRVPWMCWSRCVMGLRPLPYGCVRMEALADEIIRGDHTQPNNPFHFDALRLNLPGSSTYDPRLPRVSKIVTASGRIAGDLGTYVDDLRPVGSSKRHCTAVAHCISTLLCYLGIQDALRKRTEPSLRAGAWAGTLIHTDQDEVAVSVTQEKWDKARSYVLDIQAVLEQGTEFDFKKLEQQRVFLVYVTRTYPALKPFLKGIHLTVDSWRKNRDSEGWKVIGELAAHLDDGTPEHYSNHPETVKGVPRLAEDVASLLRLLASPRPPRRIIRSRHVITVWYGYGDASGGGFGSTFTSAEGLEYTYGIWGDDLAGCSSNFRELFNLTATLEDKVADIPFINLSRLVTTLEQQVTLTPCCEIYMFTDNAVAEGAFYRGTSTNRRLFDLIIHLKQLELHQGVQLHLTHVAGTRMQAQGTDALSRGDLTTGVMQHRDMLRFVPLHLSAVDRSSLVPIWVGTWIPAGTSLRILTPAEWFTAGQGYTHGIKNADGVWIPDAADSASDVRLWVPPPAAAEVAIEQLSFSRHKRTDLLHVFICPRLMTSRWRKRLYKLSDLLFNIPADCHPWPADMHEPLVDGLILPFLSVSPWIRRNTTSVLDVESKLRSMWASPQGDAGSLLRQLWI